MSGIMDGEMRVWIIRSRAEENGELRMVHGYRIGCPREA